MSKKQFAILVFGLLSSRGFAQDDYAIHKSDVTAQALTTSVKQTPQDVIKYDPTTGSGVPATYHFWLHRQSGVETKYGWTANTQKHEQFGVDNDSHNISAEASAQIWAAFVYGGGADLTLIDHLFIRGDYCAFVYTSPVYEPASLKGFDRFSESRSHQVDLAAIGAWL